MARKPDLAEIAIRLVRVLGADECVLVGGLAVGAHGYVRATGDVDLIVKASLESVRARLKRNGIQASLHRGDPMQKAEQIAPGGLKQFGKPLDLATNTPEADQERLSKRNFYRFLDTWRGRTDLLVGRGNPDAAGPS